MLSRVLRLGVLLLGLATAAQAAGLPTLEWDDLDGAAGIQYGAAHDRLLARIERASGIKVLWWNIEGGNTNWQISTGRCSLYRFNHPLEHNLVALARSSISPDVIGLAEFAPQSLQPRALQELERVYPYRFFFPYSSRSASGIGLFSKIQLDSYALENLPWESGSSEFERQVNRRDWLTFSSDAGHFDRSYVRLEGNWRGTRFGLVAQHLANPWRAVQKLKRENQSTWVREVSPLSGVLSKLQTAGEIFFEDGSPLSLQARELYARLERDYGKSMGASPLLLVGDFNAPYQSQVYRLFSSQLKDTFKTTTPFTFPTSCATSKNQYPPVKIDHAWVSHRVNSKLSRVLKIHGSDHYPLFVAIEP